MVATKANSVPRLDSGIFATFELAYFSAPKAVFSGTSGGQKRVKPGKTNSVTWTSDLSRRSSDYRVAKSPLYEPAPPRQPGRNGRPPLKGRRLPALKSLVDHPGLSWTTAAVAWYNGATRTVELTSQTAVWYRSGKPPVPLRWVLVRDPQGEFATQALLCTDLAVEPAQILEWFVLRWQLEVTFR